MFDGRCLMFDVKTRKPESGRQKEIADCGLRIADCGMRNAEARLREPGTRSGARYGSILRMKSDPFPGRRRLSDELFNCGEDSRKLLTRSFPIARPLPKRTMQSIQRRPRTSYSSQ